MQAIQTEVIVIGGGATGTGVLRDLAMRGFKAILVEKGDLAHGTTGRYHGLLHSGGRYVVKDPQAAVECIEENHILRRIIPHCIEDTGGFFVVTPADAPEYAPLFVAGCQKAGIPVEEVSIAHMLRQEPLLNPAITHCFRVPDGSADSFLAADCNVESARQYGARCLNYHKVIGLVCQADRIVGVRCLDLTQGQEIEIHADMIVNASGAWAGQIAGMARLEVHVIPGKGTMLAMNHRIVNTVINRCKMPADGDILVPAHTVAIIGTTDVKVEDPDNFAIQPWEVHLMLQEGDKLVPGFKDMRMLRAWAGVRPLYQESQVSDTRDVTRAFVLLDHEARDGVSGLVTITSGKWTTYRKMAEVTVDLVCQKLGVQRACRTHLEALPTVGATHVDHQAHGALSKPAAPQPYLGDHLARLEKQKSYGQLVCECELATYADVVHAIQTAPAKTIDDVRRDVRLGMGPCQGGFCTYRVAGILHKLRPELPVEATNVALRDFLQERWKGLLPILWGQQLRQERLDELIYLSIMNADHLPGEAASPLSPELYEPPGSPESDHLSSAQPLPAKNVNIIASPAPAPPSQVDVIVIGAGLSGLTAAWQAASRGLRVRLVTKGQGAVYWHTGCIDVLGYDLIEDHSPIAPPVTSPFKSISALIQANPSHPYAWAGLPAIQTALATFQEMCAQAGYPMHGSLEQNWLLPSALGTVRPTCLAPETMIAGDLRRPDPILLVGFEGFGDFYPEWIAANLSAQGIPATAITLDLPELRERNFNNGRNLADLFESPDFRNTVILAIRTHLNTDTIRALAPARIGFPAVLGLRNPLEVQRHLQSEFGLPIFEIPTLPPSIPGIRLSNILTKAIENAGGRVYNGMQVIATDADTQGHLLAVWSEAAARRKAHRARHFVLATGGILGGGILAHYTGYVQEMVCDLPIAAPADRSQWLERRFLSSQPIFSAGIQVDQNLQPVDASGKAFYQNLYAIGTGLAGADFLCQRSFDGVALVTGFQVGQNL